MAIIKPFKAYRPVKELASKIAALPYDVMNTEEAREMVEENEYSFLHHNVYYNFVPQQNTTLVDFFIDYPDENDQSLFYIFKQKENYSFPRKSYKSSIGNNDKKLFEQLIDKHNNILESYKQITECLTDFESFFSRHNNILDLVEIYRKKIIANFDFLC